MTDVIDEKLIDGSATQIRERWTPDGPEKYVCDADGNGAFEMPHGSRTPPVKPCGCLSLVDDNAVAELLAVSIRTVRRWERLGLLPRALRFGPPERPTKRFVLEQIVEWLQDPLKAAAVRSCDWVARWSEEQRAAEIQEKGV